MENGEKDILLFTNYRVFSTLYKQFLHILEDLKLEHSVNFTKLYSILPPEYHNLIKISDYFGTEKYNLFRKRILDKGNEGRRELEDEIKKYNISLMSLDEYLEEQARAEQENGKYEK